MLFRSSVRVPSRLTRHSENLARRFGAMNRQIKIWLVESPIPFVGCLSLFAAAGVLIGLGMFADTKRSSMFPSLLPIFFWVLLIVLFLEHITGGVRFHKNFPAELDKYQYSASKDELVLRN